MERLKNEVVSPADATKITVQECASIIGEQPENIPLPLIGKDGMICLGYVKWEE